MSITPEYAEEVLVEQRELAEADEASHGSLPPCEDLTEAEVSEQQQAEQETHRASAPPRGGRAPRSTR